MASSAGAACAACKYQRRRCTADCQLAEYFPQDRPRLFRNAHRLFGVSNILKTLSRVGPERRRDAMRAIVFEANAWEAYPGHGPVPLILELDQRIRQTQLQLQQVPWTNTGNNDGMEDMAAAATTVFVPQPQHYHQQDHKNNIQPPDDDMSYYFLNDEIPPPESSSTDSASEKKESKVEGVNNSFTLTGAM